MAARKKKSIVAIELAEETSLALDQARDQAQRILDACATMPVVTADDVAAADKRLLTVHACVKWIEEQKELLIRPHLDGATAVRDRVRPVEECLKSAKDLLKAKIAEAERASKAAQRAALLVVQAGEATPATLALAHGAQVTYSSATRQQAYWQAVVDDAALVPDEYKLIDMAKLHALARAGGTPPPGVRFVEGYTTVTVTK